MQAVACSCRGHLAASLRWPASPARQPDPRAQVGGYEHGGHGLRARARARAQASWTERCEPWRAGWWAGGLGGRAGVLKKVAARGPSAQTRLPGRDAYLRLPPDGPTAGEARRRRACGTSGRAMGPCMRQGTGASPVADAYEPSTGIRARRGGARGPARARGRGAGQQARASKARAKGRNEHVVQRAGRRRDATPGDATLVMACRFSAGRSHGHSHGAPFGTSSVSSRPRV